MTRRAAVRTAREVFLTLGAVLGVLCLLLTVAGFAFGVKPLVFRSGSMEPAIATGDLGISRTVDASELVKGDVVSVPTAGGDRVTHRLVSSTKDGDAYRLVLKGDANEKADADPYVVTSTERVWFSVPKAGYVVEAATSTAGVFVLGLYVALLLFLAFRRPRDEEDPPRGGSRRAERPASRAGQVAGASVLLLGLVGSSVGLGAGRAVAAPWTNPAPITGTTLTATTVPAPTNATCAQSVPNNNALVSWTSAGTGYTYQIALVRNSDGATVDTVTTTATSLEITAGLLTTLGRVNMTAVVKARLTSTASWVSTGSTSALFYVRGLGFGTQCGTG